MFINSTQLNHSSERDGGIDVVLFNQSRKQGREENNAPEDFPFTKPALQKMKNILPAGLAEMFAESLHFNL